MELSLLGYDYISTMNLTQMPEHVATDVIRTTITNS